MIGSKDTLLAAPRGVIEQSVNETGMVLFTPYVTVHKDPLPGLNFQPVNTYAGSAVAYPTAVEARRAFTGMLDLMRWLAGEPPLSSSVSVVEDVMKTTQEDWN